MKNWQSTRRDFIKGSAAAAATLASPRLVGARESKVVRIRSKTDLKSIDPAHSLTISDFDVRQAILNNLILYKPGDAWTWEHDAAEYIEQVDPLHTEFRLRPGIMWTNGYGEMTAEDVKYSFERMNNPELEAEDHAEFEHLEDVVIKDKYSGVIVMRKPVANLWTNTLPRHMSAIICKKAWEERGAWSKGLGNDIPCSSGPYKLKRWEPQVKVVLERNELWNGPKPHFDEVEYILIEDENAAEVAYLAGELDVAHVSVGSGAEFQKNPPENTDVYVKSTTGFIFLGLNVQHEPFDDIRVRQAIRKAIDVNQVIEGAYFGLGVPSTGLLAPGVLGHRPGTVPERDVEGAKALLAEAGFPNGFKTDVATLNNNTDVSACQIIQANLAEIGIEMQISPYAGGTYWSLGLESEGDAWKDLQMNYTDWTSAPDPRRATQWFVCDQVGEWNWQRWCNEEYSQLDAEGGTETDLEKRAAIYEKMTKVMWDDAAFINIAHPPRVVLVRNHIDPQMLPNGYIYFRRLKAKA